MRIAVLILVIATGAGAAAAQDRQKPAQPAAQAAPRPADAKPAQPVPRARPAPVADADGQALRDAYAAMTLNDRLSIQSDLIWSGHYNGTVSGEFGERTIAAVKGFQKANKGKQTGILTSEERTALADAVREKQDRVGWRLIEDAATGARLGIPAKLAPRASAAKSGSRWTSARNEVQIETMRLREPGTTLASVFEQQKKEPGRKVEYNLLRSDFFVVSGLQGLKKFYVRGHAKDNEVRAMTILYDQAMDGIMAPVVVAMSSAYLAFPSANGASPKRKVEYATGIVVTKAGDVIASEQATDRCEVIVVAGHGNADRIARDENAGLALLRLYGARDLNPVALAADAPRSADLVLVGISDPQEQRGGNAISTANVRIGTVSGSTVTISPMPELGFAGAAAIDDRGQLVGAIEMKPHVAGFSSPGAGLQPALIPAATIRKFLEGRNIAPATGRAGLDRAKAGIVRIICIRK